MALHPANDIIWICKVQNCGLKSWLILILLNVSQIIYAVAWLKLRGKYGDKSAKYVATVVVVHNCNLLFLDNKKK